MMYIEDSAIPYRIKDVDIFIRKAVVSIPCQITYGSFNFLRDTTIDPASINVLLRCSVVNGKTLVKLIL